MTRELGGCMAGCGSQGLQGRVRELGAAGQGAGARGCTGLRGGSTGEVRREPARGPGVGRVERVESRAWGSKVGRGERVEEPHGAAGVGGQR